MTKNQVSELRWIRALVAERAVVSDNVPTWLMLEWLDDSIKRLGDEPRASPVNEPPYSFPALNHKPKLIEPKALHCMDCGAVVDLPILGRCLSCHGKATHK